MIVTDKYSRYPEVEILLSTSEKSVLPRLENIFAGDKMSRNQSKLTTDLHLMDKHFQNMLTSVGSGMLKSYLFGLKQMGLQNV